MRKYYTRVSKDRLHPALILRLCNQQTNFYVLRYLAELNRKLAYEAREQQLLADAYKYEKESSIWTSGINKMAAEHNT
jgi:hypothetical protein